MMLAWVLGTLALLVGLVCTVAAIVTADDPWSEARRSRRRTQREIDREARRTR